ncbi:MAG: UvrB/UvrC motif-containing protein [Planctomycetes bacterium]|nr:UvrB/UvrC motif-containing protein [Planctomycetota bacterium]
MQCEGCQKNAATVHLTDVSNNTKKEIHLCESCAKLQGVTIKSYLHKSPTYPELLTQLVHSQSEAPADEKDVVCPRCGITYRKFRSTGKFGCPNDYSVFKKGLFNLLEKIHGKVEHKGKVPLRASDQIVKQKELRALRADLEKAVREEAYERAAQIRDRIYGLEGRQGEV